MQRRLRIVMDEERNIESDGKTNWVCPNRIIKWNVQKAIETGRDTLVIQPDNLDFKSDNDD